jgi:hypothetical protein
MCVRKLLKGLENEVTVCRQNDCRGAWARQHRPPRKGTLGLHPPSHPSPAVECAQQTGQDRARQGKTGQDRARQGKTGQDRARQGKTGQDRAVECARESKWGDGCEGVDGKGGTDVRDGRASRESEKNYHL